MIGFCDYGAWGEAVVVPANYVYKMPSNMSYQDGAALTMNYLTAYIMLFDIANLRKGMSVFFHNVGGGVVSDSLPLTHPKCKRDVSVISGKPEVLPKISQW